MWRFKHSINQQADDSTKFVQWCSPHPFLNLASEVEEIIVNFLIGVFKYNVQNIIRNKKWKSIMLGICIFGFIHTPRKIHYYVLSASLSNFGRCPAPGKVLALKNINLVFCSLSCFWMLNIWVTVQYTGYDSSHNLSTEQSPKESDNTRCCVNAIVILKMITIVLDTCRGM